MKMYLSTNEGNIKLPQEITDCVLTFHSGEHYTSLNELEIEIHEINGMPYIRELKMTQNKNDR